VVTEPGSVLAMMAHAYDAELWAGGTLALHARAATATVALERAEDVRMPELRAEFTTHLPQARRCTTKTLTTWRQRWLTGQHNVRS